MRQLAGDCGVELGRPDPLSAAGVSRRDEQYATTAERKRAVRG